MSDNPFQREIKRSGYLRGTQMRKVRNRVILAVFTFTLGSYALAFLTMNRDEDKTYKTMIKEKEWKEERQKRLKDVIEMKQRLLKDPKTGRSE